MNLLKQNYVKYGLILACVLVLCLLIMEVTGQNDSFDEKSPLFVIYQFIAPAVVWYLGIKAKKKMLKNKLTFKQGLIEGIKISLVFAIVSPFIFLAYYTLVNPGILNFVRTVYGLTGANDSFVIAVDMGMQFVVSLIFGTLYAAIISFFMKSK